MVDVPVETIAVRGLDAAAEIAVDRNGIAHIRAASERDAFFLQGFNAARDRLWQLDLWRKRGLGLLAADFGPGFLEQDRASRLFLYRGDMAAEWAAYADDARAICTAFVAGINAYVTLTEREPERLPPEFGVLGTRPSLWSPEDVVRIRSHGLTRNALSEVVRSMVLSRSDAATDLLRRNLDPPTTPRIPDGIALGDVPLEALDLFRLAQANVTFSEARLACPRERASVWRKVDDQNAVLPDATLEGSNNWAIHGSHTASGLPILASDPHRQHGVPSLRYIVHLEAPGLAVIGAGEPVVPGVSLGHNGALAFGLTIFGIDQEDVYVLEFDPADPERYRFGDGFERMRVIEETIPVQGGPDEHVRMLFSRHGPVLWRDAARTRAVALRSVWAEPGAAPYLRSLTLMRTRDVPSFVQAARGWGSPAVNLVAADTKGHIAWLPAGFAPSRPNHDGLLPVPGDGRFEWAGFIDPASYPVIVDPPDGHVFSANEMNLPPDWDHASSSLGFEWAERSRATRIAEVLTSTRAHTVADSVALQTDVVSIAARRLCRLLPERFSKAEAEKGRMLLAAWDHALDAKSGAAALHEVWWSLHLKPAVLSRFSSDALLAKLLAPGDVDGLLARLETLDAAWGADPSGARDRLFEETLSAAMHHLTSKLGPDREAWRWGRLHHGYFEHALSNIAPDRRGTMDVGPVPFGGSSSTPMNAGYRLNDFRVTHGASFRMVVDIGDLDASVTINAPGQSGDPRSPHYRDLIESWSRGEMVRMPWSRVAVDAATESLIRLVPV